MHRVQEIYAKIFRFTHSSLTQVQWNTHRLTHILLLDVVWHNVNRVYYFVEYGGGGNFEAREVRDQNNGLSFAWMHLDASIEYIYINFNTSNTHVQVHLHLCTHLQTNDGDGDVSVTKIWIRIDVLRTMFEQSSCLFSCFLTPTAVRFLLELLHHRHIYCRFSSSPLPPTYSYFLWDTRICRVRVHCNHFCSFCVNLLTRFAFSLILLLFLSIIISGGKWKII